MSSRDRSVIIVVGALAMLGAFWFLALAPKRKAAQQLTAQVVEQTERLDKAKQSAGVAAAARLRYDRDYATVARLGKAVPVDDEVPSLLYQLETAAAKTKVDFRTMKLDSTATPAAAAPAVAQVASVAKESGTTSATTTSSSTAVPATSAAAATLPPGAAVGPAGFPTMPFSFDFEGTYFGMENFLRELNRFTRADRDRIDVRGRLLTVDGVSLAVGRRGFPRVSAKVSVTAYLLPPEQGLTAGATPTAPGATAPPAAGAGTSSPTPPATATGATP